MTPIFYEDSLGERLSQKASDAIDAAHDADPNSDEKLVEDPQALAAAEHAARTDRNSDRSSEMTGDWVVVLGPTKLSGVSDAAGFNSRLITAPLEAAGIPLAWDPYPPSQMPSYRVGYGAVDRSFTLLVPADRASEAVSLLDTVPGSASPYGIPAQVSLPDDSKVGRIHWVVWFFVILLLINILLVVASFVFSRLGLV